MKNGKKKKKSTAPRARWHRTSGASWQNRAFAHRLFACISLCGAHSCLVHRDAPRRRHHFLNACASNQTRARIRECCGTRAVRHRAHAHRLHAHCNGPRRRGRHLFLFGLTLLVLPTLRLHRFRGTRFVSLPIYHFVYFFVCTCSIYCRCSLPVPRTERRSRLILSCSFVVAIFICSFLPHIQHLLFHVVVSVLIYCLTLFTLGVYSSCLDLICLLLLYLLYSSSVGLTCLFDLFPVVVVCSRFVLPSPYALRALCGGGAFSDLRSVDLPSHNSVLCAVYFD